MRFPNEPGVRYRNFFTQIVEKTLQKVAFWIKSFSPKPRRLAEGKLFPPRANCRVFFNLQDEDISIPDTNGHSENLFLSDSLYNNFGSKMTWD